MIRSQRISKLVQTLNGNKTTFHCKANIERCEKLLKVLNKESKELSLLQDSITNKLLTAKKNKSFGKKLFGNSELGKIRKELLQILIKVVTLDIEITQCKIYKIDYEVKLALLNKDWNLKSELLEEESDLKQALHEYTDNARKLSEKAEKYKNLSDKKISKDILEFQQFIDEN